MADPAVSGPEESARAGRHVDTQGKFRKCLNPACEQSLFVGDIEKNFHCCKFCGYHFRIGARERIAVTLDPGSWTELFSGLESVDPLDFVGQRSYRERLEESRAETGLEDAIVCGAARLEGREVLCGVMDYGFMNGTMGSVVGEKVARLAERAAAARLPLLIFCCSGGARVDEGVFSLMQMAKTSAALQRYHAAGLPYLSILTHPTLAGVSASFAFLADVILAEPRAMIGFTGARVIEQTIKVKLPEGFQEAEFLLEHGQIDAVVPRKDLRAVLARILRYLTPAGPPQPAPGEALPQPAARKPRTRRTGRALTRSPLRTKRHRRPA